MAGTDRRALSLGVFVSLLLTPTSIATGEPGGDAPDDWSARVNVPAGSYDGTLGANDRADNYEIDNPSDLLVRVTLTLIEGPYVELEYRNGDGWVGGAGLSPESPTATRTFYYPGDAVWAEVHTSDTTYAGAAVSYTLLLEIVERPMDEAPDEWSAAVTVPPGAYDGSVNWQWGDLGDWYRIENPPDTYTRVTVTHDGYVVLYVRTDDGRLLDEVWSGSAISRTLVLPASALRVGVSSNWGAGYTLTLEHGPTTDFAVTGLSVTDPGLGAERTVAFDLTNLGPASGTGRADLAVRTTSDDTLTWLAVLTPDLAGGETRHVVVPWDPVATGTVGDAVIIARAWGPYDSDASNGEATASTYGLSEGTGQGRTVGATGGTCPAVPLLGNARPCASYDIRPGQPRANVCNTVFPRVCVGTTELCASVPVLGTVRVCTSVPP